jgi:hypothetical protein
MSKFSILYLLIFSTYCQAQTIYPSGVSGCIARWTFDAAEGGNLTTIQDWSGNNNHGSNNNIVSSAGWKGIPFTAGKFDGNSSYCLVPHSLTLNAPTELTMISIINFSNFNSALCNYNQIISKGYPHFIAGNYGLGVGDSPYDNDCNIYSPANTQLVSQCGNGTFTTLAGNYLQLNKWYFLATTISNSNVINYQIIMDAGNKAPSMNQISNVNGNYNIGNNNQNISIGRHLNPQYPYWVDAKMDEVILFNRALSPAELYSVYEYIYGYPTALAEQGDNLQIFNVNIQNSVLHIETSEENYSCRVLNANGQILNNLVGCNGSTNISISAPENQIVYVNIVTNRKHSFNYCKICR